MIPTTITNKSLKRSILNISYQKKLSHIQSCLTAVDLLQEIYDTKKYGDRVVLSSGHAGLALYVVLERDYPNGKKAQDIFDHHGVHPDRCADCHIDCSAGSLGHGLGISVGLALADPKHDVWVVTTDGEWAEGSIYEAIRLVRRLGLKNIHIFVNCNGFSGYDEVSLFDIERQLKPYQADIRLFQTNVDYLGVPELSGLSGHYQVMDQAMYTKALGALQ